MKLFKRSGNHLELTREGREALPLISSALVTMCLAVDKLTASVPEPTIKVAADITFSSMWLAPKLAEFRQVEPTIEVWVIPPIESASLAGMEVDMAIQYFSETKGGYNISLLHLEILSPVCSPAYMQRAGSLSKPEDLKKHRLISVESDQRANTYPGWQEWAAEYDTELHSKSICVHFAHAVPAIEAALSDQGIALISQSNIARYLQSGELILPFGDGFTLKLPRYIVTDAHHTNPACTRLHDWLIRNSH